MEAQRFLKRLDLPIEPRRRWPNPSCFEVYGWAGSLSFPNEYGRVLARWQDPGWGDLVRAGKRDGIFSNELVDAAVELFGRWGPTPSPTWITYVPSLRNPNLVANFAERLGEQLGIPVYDSVKKVVDNEPQKSMHNSHFQAWNLDGVFEVDGEVFEEPVLLVDDIVDSRWTFTVVGQLLQEAGASLVFPLALSDTSKM